MAAALEQRFGFFSMLLLFSFVKHLGRLGSNLLIFLIKVGGRGFSLSPPINSKIRSDLILSYAENTSPSFYHSNHVIFVYLVKSHHLYPHKMRWNLPSPLFDL